MAFKLKSPFHITEVKPTLGKGGIVGQGSSSGVVTGLNNIDIASVEGNQTIKPEPNNEVVEQQVKQADEGVPLGLNPKQEARFKTRKYKKGIRDDARFDRKTEKASRIYERNQFEAVGKDGAYVNPDKAASIKSDRAEKGLELDSKFKILDSDLPYAEKEKMIKNIDSKSKFSKTNTVEDKEKKSPPKDNLVMRNKEEEFKNPLLQMKGKPNRAGTPVRMLKSMEDTTPMKYKSVRKTGRENLMSALAKQGEPIDYNKFESRIKSNSSFATPGTEFKATEAGTSSQPSRVTVGDRAKKSVKKAVKLGLSAGL